MAPMIVMTEESASDRLFTASSVTAMERDSSPTTALNAASSTLVAMPTTLVLMIVRSRSAAIVSRLTGSLLMGITF